MRSTKNRSRFKQNRNRASGNIINRVFESSGPEGKVRGTPQQIIEKYNQLARDFHLAHDSVSAQNSQQHAEHYTRLLSAAQREADLRRENAKSEGDAPRDEGGGGQALQNGNGSANGEALQDGGAREPAPQSAADKGRDGGDSGDALQDDG